MDWKCPNCGAQTSGDSCEYCGTVKPLQKIPLDTFFQDKKKGKTDKSIRIYVAPFKCDRGKAIRLAKSNFKGNLLRFYDDNGFSEIKISSFFVPMLQYMKFEKTYAFGYLCDQSRLPSIFPSDGFRKDRRFISADTYGLISDSYKDKQKEEIGRADNQLDLTTITMNPQFMSDEFVKCGHIIFVPFWVVEGKYKKYSFSSLITGGGYDTTSCNNRQITFRLTDENGKEVNLSDLRKLYKQIESQKESVQKKTIEIQEEKKQIKKNRKRTTPIGLGILIGMGMCLILGNTHLFMGNRVSLFDVYDFNWMGITGITFLCGVTGGLIGYFITKLISHPNA